MDTVPEAEEWVTIAEAARRLRVTPTAIRGRIERGTLEVKPNGNRGRLVRVPNPEGKGNEKGSDHPSPQGSDRVSIPVAELLQLTARLVEAEKEAAAAPTLRETVTALRQALDSERLLRDELRRELERRARPWWRRLTG